MAWIKKLCFTLLGLLVLYRFCSLQTDGFALGRISSNLSHHPEWEAEGNFPRNLLDQPFYYLGSGAQAFAFASEDGAAVIKFFRHHRTRHILAPLIPYLPSLLKNRLQRTLDKRFLKRLKDFSSYKIAYDTLREETGLLYLHLNKTDDLNHQITLYDKIGIHHRVDLDQFEFVVQKRANPLYATLEKWIESQELDLAKEALSQLVNLLQHRMEKGVYDKDPDLKTNFGLIGTTPIQFDIGRFKCGVEEDPQALERITDRLVNWLEPRAPTLAQYLLNEVEKS